jgi:hypothetical protein
MSNIIRGAKVVAVIAALAVGAWVVSTILTVLAETDRFENADALSIAERRELREAVNEDRTKINLLREQIKALGAEPVVDPVTPLPTVVRIPGEDGEDGDDGDTGRTGERGPGPTDEQIEAAVAAYCATRNDCTPPPPADGKDGTNGRDGSDGAPGRGIASVVCTGGLTPMTFTFTYSDGSSETVTCGTLEPVPAE